MIDDLVHDGMILLTSLINSHKMTIKSIAIFMGTDTKALSRIRYHISFIRRWRENRSDEVGLGKVFS